MATAASDLTPEQSRMLRDMRTFAKRFEAKQAEVAKMENDRADLYIAARAIDPPLTFRVIADTFGVTEAAVMQKIKRHNGTAAPRGRKATT